MLHSGVLSQAACFRVQAAFRGHIIQLAAASASSAEASQEAAPDSSSSCDGCELTSHQSPDPAGASLPASPDMVEIQHSAEDESSSEEEEEVVILASVVKAQRSRPNNSCVLSRGGVGGRSSAQVLNRGTAGAPPSPQRCVLSPQRTVQGGGGAATAVRCLTGDGENNNVKRGLLPSFTFHRYRT